MALSTNVPGVRHARRSHPEASTEVLSLAWLPCPQSAEPSRHSLVCKRSINKKSHHTGSNSKFSAEECMLLGPVSDTVETMDQQLRARGISDMDLPHTCMHWGIIVNCGALTIES